MSNYHYEFARAWGLPTIAATFKQYPADFIVEEELRFELTGVGEHLYVLIEKEQQNTHWCAKQIARWAQVPNRNVSFAGLKDRQGVTRQWFSIWLPGKPDPDTTLDIPGVQLIQQVRHRAKLQRGALSSNRFHIVLRNVGDDSAAIDQALTVIARNGVPNYFGAQRFGLDYNNVATALTRPAQQWLQQGRGDDIYVSAVRSYLFNVMLEQRILQGSWRQAQPGEPLVLAGSNSWFEAEGTAAESTRIEAADCSTSALMYCGQMSVSDSAFYQWEVDQLKPYQQLMDWLQPVELKPLRRPLILRPENMQWQHTDRHTLTLSFGLPTGGYATSVLHELFVFDSFA